MQDFVHLHVHTQYSILDGQASIPRLVDKAMANGMRGIAVTDHGDMFGIKEFFNYVNKKNGGTNAEIKDLKKRIAALESGKEEVEDPQAEIASCRESLEAARKKLFKPIFGCEMYVARRRMQDKEGKPDQSGYHLVVLAKNLKGYHNLIKLVSKAWTEGFYMRPRTDRTELEKYHEGLIVCSACLGGEIPRRIIADEYEQAEEAAESGFTSVTHLYSATSGFHKVDQKVHVGVTQAGYGVDELFVELIGDGCHVPKELLRLVNRFKGAEKICLVTDAMRAAGTNVSESYLGKVCPENRVIIDDGVAKLPDKSCFAGSIGTMDKAFKFAVEKAHIPMNEASRMVSLTPATLMNMQNRKGSIEVGKDADLVVMNRSFITQKVFVDGKLVYQNK